jgi:hypothetical protein
MSGFVAGGVAGEIRKHVEAALREAETRREPDRVQHDLQTARDIQQELLPQMRRNSPRSPSPVGISQPTKRTATSIAKRSSDTRDTANPAVETQNRKSDENKEKQRGRACQGTISRCEVRCC